MRAGRYVASPFAPNAIAGTPSLHSGSPRKPWSFRPGAVESTSVIAVLGSDYYPRFGERPSHNRRQVRQYRGLGQSSKDIGGMLAAKTIMERSSPFYPKPKRTDSAGVNNMSNRNDRRDEHVVCHRDDSNWRAPTRAASSRRPVRPRSPSRRPTAADNDYNAESAAAAAAAAVVIPAIWLNPNGSTDQILVTAGFCSRTTSAFACDTRRHRPSRSTAVGLTSLACSPRINPVVAAEAQCLLKDQEQGHSHRHSNHYHHLQRGQNHHKQAYNLPAEPQDIDSPNTQYDSATVVAAAAAAKGKGYLEFVDEHVGCNREDEGSWWDTGSHASRVKECSHTQQSATDASRAASAETDKWAQRLPFGLKLGSRRRRKRRREDTPPTSMYHDSEIASTEPQSPSAAAAAASPPTATKKGDGFRRTAGSCFRWRRGSAKPQQGCKAVGKALVVAALAYSSIFKSAQGTRDNVCALLVASFEQNKQNKQKYKRSNK